MIKSSSFVFIINIFFIVLSGHAHATKEIVLATTERIPYIGTKLPSKGYVHELVKHVFEQAGYKVTINFYPLARSMYLLETGRVDGMLPSYYDVSQLKDVIYSAPFSQNKSAY